MTKTWFDSVHCTSRAHCRACRTSAAFRASVAARYGLTPDFACPASVTVATLPKRAPRPPRPACVHLGAPTGATRDCPSCHGRVRLKLFACAVRGEIVLDDCRTCKDHTQTPPASPGASREGATA